MDLIIDYRDSDGNVTTRQISDPTLVEHDCIDAHCNIRNGRRTFKLVNIIQAVNPETGEIIENMWKHFGIDLSENGKPKIISLVAPILPAIQALKYFCLQVRRKRGFAKPERKHIIDFIIRHANVPFELHSELDEWLVKIWCGDMYEECDPAYIDALKWIPERLRSDCRSTAHEIARGSGRGEIADDIIQRINREFPPSQ
jgi:hypothetical protein